MSNEYDIITYKYMTAEEHRKIVENNKVPFNHYYENVISKLIDESNIDFCFKILLYMKEKRKFGFQKYGENSFQSTFENALACPITNHIIDELIDLINYLFHYLFQSLFFQSNEKSLTKEEIVFFIKTLNNFFKKLNEFKESDEAKE